MFEKFSRIQPTHLTQFYLYFGNNDWLCYEICLDGSDFSLQLKYVYQVLDCLSFEFSMLDVSKNGILNKYTLYQNDIVHFLGNCINLAQWR